MFKKVQTKIILMLFLILSTIIAFNYYIVNGVVRSALTEAIVAEAMAAGQGFKSQWQGLMEYGLNFGESKMDEELCDNLIKDNPQMEFVAAVDLNGDVIAGDKHVEHDIFKNTPELYNNIGSKDSVVVDFTLDGKKLLCFLLPLENTKEEVVGNIIFAYSNDLIQEPLEELSKFNSGVSIIMLISSLILIITFLSIWVTNPIRKLYTATREIFYNGTSTMSTVEVNSNDELGRLAVSFNLMVSRLKDTTVSKEFMDNIISSMTESLVVIRPDNTIDLVNDAAIELFQYSKKELIGSKISVLILDKSLFTEEFREELRQTDSYHECETIALTKAGDQVAIRMYCSLMKSSETEEYHIVCTIRDVTELKKAEDLLFYQANYDMLTAIPNRHYLESTLESLVEEGVSEGTQHVYLSLDLDKFKIVNDVCGHHAGDQLLRHIAHMMKEGLREDDFIARVGGDEFSILLRNTTTEEACKIGERLCKIVKDFNFAWDDKIFTVGVSIGAVVIDSEMNDIQEMLTAADRACYVCKERGGNRVQLYNKSDKEFTEKQEEVHIVPTLTKAIEHNRFFLNFQPIVSCDKSDDVIWFEVLIRMNDADGKVIMPSAFLSPAERYNMMPAIDKWVMHRFFSSYHETVERLYAGKRMKFNINISGASINEDKFLDYIKGEFERYQVPPEVVCFEITETCAVSNFVDASNFIKELKAMGCSFALDDFGSGLSSFTYLKHLPVDYVKIDGTFVCDMDTNKVDYAMVSSINEIAHLLGKKTIGEYVENEAINECLREIGVDYGQGYWLGKPDSLEHYSELV